MSRPRRLAASLALIFAVGVMTLSASDAKGTVFYKSKAKDITATLKYAYLVKGPDAVDPKLTIRRLILSATDLGAKIQACTTMKCADSDLNDGLEVDFDAGPRLNYWMVLNDQLVQYSGTVVPSVFTSTADTATRLAGKLVFDQTSAGGPRVSADFDTPLLKTFTKAR